MYVTRPDAIFYHHLDWFPSGKPPPFVSIQEGTNVIDLKFEENEYFDATEVDCIPTTNQTYNQMGKKLRNCLNGTVILTGHQI